MDPMKVKIPNEVKTINLKLKNIMTNKYIYVLLFFSFFNIYSHNSNIYYRCNPTKEKLIFQDSITGIYTLKTCENGRFKIKIYKDKIFFYKILDNGKTISKGKLKIKKEKAYLSLLLGNIDAVYSNNTIDIQNYGNAMNPYTHFTQCDDKYLTFTKV